MPFRTSITTANMASRAREALPFPVYINAAIIITSIPGDRQRQNHGYPWFAQPGRQVFRMAARQRPTER